MNKSYDPRNNSPFDNNDRDTKSEYDANRQLKETIVSIVTTRIPDHVDPADLVDPHNEWRLS